MMVVVMMMMVVVMVMTAMLRACYGIISRFV